MCECVFHPFSLFIPSPLFNPSLFFLLSRLDTKNVLVTATLVIVLFTVMVLGGSTLPVLNYLNPKVRSSSTSREHDHTVSLSKTEGREAEVFSDSDDHDYSLRRKNRFEQWDLKYFMPLFRRRVTRREVRLNVFCVLLLSVLTSCWHITD